MNKQHPTSLEATILAYLYELDINSPGSVEQTAVIANVCGVDIKSAANAISALAGMHLLEITKTIAFIGESISLQLTRISQKGRNAIENRGPLSELPNALSAAIADVVKTRNLPIRPPRFEHEFQATVQYGDWHGAAAADETDFISIRTYLRKSSHIADHEFLIGLRMSYSENTAESPQTTVSIAAFVITAPDYQSARKYLEGARPVEVREVRIEMPITQFFSYFKRFSVAIAWQDLEFNGRAYSTRY